MMSVFNSRCIGFNRHRFIPSHSLVSLISTYRYPYRSTSTTTTSLCSKSDKDNERKVISKYRTENSNEYARHQNNKISGDSSLPSSSGVRLKKCLLGLSRRAADVAIAEGRVTIDGKVVTAAGTRVAEKSVVRLDGKVGANE